MYIYGLLIPMPPVIHFAVPRSTEVSKSRYVHHRIQGHHIREIAGFIVSQAPFQQIKYLALIAHQNRLLMSFIHNMELTKKPAKKWGDEDSKKGNGLQLHSSLPSRLPLLIPQ